MHQAKMIKFMRDFQKVSGILRVLIYNLSRKLTSTVLLKDFWKLHSETNKTNILRIIKGHNSRTIKVRYLKIKFSVF